MKWDKEFKNEQLRGLELEQLNKLKAEKYVELHALQEDKMAKRLKKSHQLKYLRRILARIHTVLHEKQNVQIEVGA
jgi:ribosomal protein L29